MKTRSSAQLSVPSVLRVLLLVALVGSLNVADAQATPASLVAAYDATEGGYIVNPSTNTAQSNIIPPPPRLCSTVDAVRYYVSSNPVSLYRDFNSNFYGARVQCLSAVVKAYPAASNCLQSATFQYSIQVMNTAISTTLPVMEFDFGALFNQTSFLETLISTSSPVTVRTRIYVTGSTCSALDVLYMSDVIPEAVQPIAALAGVPTVTGVIQNGGVWLGNGSISGTATSTVGVALSRVAQSSAAVYKVVLVPANVDCNSSDVLNTTRLNSTTPYVAAYTEGVASIVNVYTNMKVYLQRPNTPGLYSLCAGLEPGGTSATPTNTTATTSMVRISAFRVLDIQSPVYVTPPADWQMASTTPSSAPSASWDFTFDGLAGHVSATTDSAAIILAEEAAANCSDTTSHALAAGVWSAMSLSDVVPGRVVWSVPASQVTTPMLSTVITVCYKRDGDNNTWRAVPSYHSLYVNITKNALAPYVSAPALTPAPPTTTTATPPATPTPPTGSPAPTVTGGCRVTTQAALTLFGNSGAIRLGVSTTWSSSDYAQFAAVLSNQLCVKPSDMSVTGYGRQSSQWYVYIDIATRTDTVIVNGVSFGPYVGESRLAAFMFDIYPNSTDQQTFGIQSIAMLPKSAASGSGSSDNVGELVVGVAIAGVISVLICSCGLVYLCCKRIRRRLRGDNRGANIVAHHGGEELTVIPRQMVIEARARVVIARRARRNPEDPRGDSSPSDDEHSDSDMSTANGAVMERTSSDVQRAAAARRRVAADANQQEMIDVLDPSVYGPVERGSGELGYSAPPPPMIPGVPRPRKIHVDVAKRLATPPIAPTDPLQASNNPLTPPTSADADARRLVVAHTPPYDTSGRSIFSESEDESSVMPHRVVPVSGGGSGGELL